MNVGLATPASPRLASLYVLFTVSGACGLCYQVLWARWLSLVLGTTTGSVSIVLSSFMLGLALGSWVAGRTLPRVRRPLRVYALLEVGIGAVAIAFPWLAAGAERVLALLVDTDTSRPLAMLARATLAFVLLLLPTAMMGATLPQLAALLRGCVPPARRWRLGLLYALNTAGAAVGTVAVSFAGIELLGLRGTTLVAALLNLGVGLLALRLDRELPPLAPAAPPAAARGSAPPAAGLALGVLAASGAAALAGEVLWTRWLEVLAGNSSYAFSLMLLMYLTGIALGAAAPSLVVRRLRHPALWLVATQVAAAAWLLVAVVIFDRLAGGFAALSRQPIAMPTLIAYYTRAALLLLPSALLSGAVFPLATRLMSPSDAEASGEVAARAYSWNTFGAVAGALLAGWVIAPRLDFAEAMLFLAIAYGAIGVAATAMLLPRRLAPRWRWAVLMVAAVSVSLTAAAQLRRSGGYARHLERHRPQLRVLYHGRSAQAVTTVVAPRDGDRFRASLLVNATGMTRLVTATKLMAHLPLLAHPDPRDTLVICFGMGTTFRSAMSHGGRVVAVELVPEVIDAFPVFHPDAAALSEDPRGRLVVDDGRNYLQLTHQRFDVITIDPPPPIDAAGVNHLHSLDFMRLARGRLKPGGIMAHWIPYPHAGAGVSDATTFEMLVHTFAVTFPHVLVVPGVEPIGIHLLGSERPIPWDPRRVAERMADPAVRADLEEWGPLPEGYFLQLRPLEARLADPPPVITDDRPRLEFDLIRLWRQGGRKPGRRIHW